MNKSIRITLMVIAAFCTLLLAGGMPVGGVPMVYHGLLMTLLLVGIALLSLYAAVRLARGQLARLFGGLVCLFLTCVGVAAVWHFGEMCYSFADKGGLKEAALLAVCFGSMGFGCMALVGVLFAVIFGFLTTRLMTKRLWLAALHAWVALMLFGFRLDEDAGLSQIYTFSGPVGNCEEDAGVFGDGDSGKTLGVTVTGFDVLRYDATTSYSLMEYENGAWKDVATVQRRGDELVLGQERWPVSGLVAMPGMPMRVLLLRNDPPRAIMERESSVVKEYRATCRLRLREGDKTVSERTAELRVNSPIRFEGYLVYLMSYSSDVHGTMVDLKIKKAPARIPFFSMLGIILCTVGWTFTPSAGRRATPSAEPAS